MENDFYQQQNTTQPKKSKKHIVIISALAVLIILLSFLIGFFAGHDAASTYVVTKEEYNIIKNLPLFKYAVNAAGQLHYGDIDYNKIDVMVTAGFLSSLDDFSYLANYPNEPFSNVSYGISVQSVNGKLIVSSLAQNGPAQQAGIKRGDYIYSIDNTVVEGKSVSEVNSIIAQKESTEIVVLRARQSEIIDGKFTETAQAHSFSLTKTEIVSREAFYLSDIDPQDPSVGYIKLESFSSTGEETVAKERTVKDFAKAVYEFKKDGKQKLILDLRSNLGGDLKILEVISSFLIEENGVSNQLPLLELEDKAGNVRKYYSNSCLIELENGEAIKSNFIGVPIAVLMNSMTASASEALMGAIGYYGTGIMIGEERSYGKGVAQAVLSIGDIYIMGITSAKYYVYTKEPEYQDGRKNLHGVGIKADISTDDKGVMVDDICPQIKDERIVARALLYLRTQN